MALAFVAIAFLNHPEICTAVENSQRNWPSGAEIDEMFGSGVPSAVEPEAYAAANAAEAHDFRKAIEEWTKVIRVAPNFSSAYYHRALAYDELALSSEAIADVQEFNRREPNSAKGWRLAGIIQADAGNFRTSLANCNHALALDPNDAFALALRADVHRLDGDWDEALEDADAALKMYPGLPRAYQVKGRVYLEQKRYRDAIGAFSKVIHLKPNWPNPLVVRAGTFESAGDFKKAAADYRLAIKRFPKSETAHDGMAWFLATCREASFRDGKEAVREATLACELGGWKDPYVLATLAAALAETGDFSAAVHRGEQALKTPVLPREGREKIEKQLACYRANKPWRDLP